jgi:hypothetical protein
MMRAYKVTVTDERSVLIAADDKNRKAYINIVGNQSIAVGSVTVTFATGLILAKHSAPIEIDVPLKETLYAICDTGDTDDVRVLLPDGD